MTNNTKPIIEKDCRCQNRPKGWGLYGHALNCPLFRPTVSTQKNMSSDMSTNDKQLSDLGCGRHPIGEQCECVGYAVTEAIAWEERFDTFMEDQCKDGGEEKFISKIYPFNDELKAFIKQEIATAVQEERKRIKSYLELLEPKITLSQELVNDIIEAITDKE